MKRFFLAVLAIVTATCTHAKQTDNVYSAEGDTKPAAEVEYVDLGLPSRTKWATCNIGASAPEDWGDYYGWGCLEPYQDSDDVEWPAYFKIIGGTGKSTAGCGKEGDPLKEFVYPNNRSISGSQWDVARAKLGGKWRIPTSNELNELFDSKYCKCEWTTLNDVSGYKITSKKNGKSIFLPAAGRRVRGSEEHLGTRGFYWSSTPSQYNGSGNVAVKTFEADRVSGYEPYRYYGFSIRPVFR